MVEETFCPSGQSVDRIKQLMAIRAPTDDESQIIDKSFNSKFTYNVPVGDKIIPEKLFASSCWSDRDLQSLKCILNEAKSELDDVQIDHWQKHTKRTHLSTEIMRLVRSEFKPVMSTQAWFKFYEILGHYSELVPKEADSYHSVHLCEAPGAFVASLQHFLFSQDRHFPWKWIASTLNPYYEGNELGVMIDEDIFIRGTLANWCFGVDGTGNIMNDENVKFLKKICSERGLNEVHLVTCDGSVDCANNPAEQETIISRLVFCEVVAGLQLLAVTGSMVVKMFTLFEHSSVCIMYLLCCLFKQVNVIKPVTSKPGNSEVYVVATGFNGIDHNLLDQLVDHFGPEAPYTALFDHKDIPQSFLKQHLECCRKFSNSQIQVISSNLELYQRIAVDYRLDLKLQFARHFICRFKVKRAKDVLYRPAKPTSTETERKSPSRTRNKPISGTKSRHSGTLASRQQQMLQSTEELVMSKRSFGVSTLPLVSDCSGKTILHEADLLNFRPQMGRKFHVFRSSKFCERSFLEQYLHLLSLLPNQVVADDKVNIELIFCLNHLTDLAQCSKSKQTIFIVSPEDYALIMDLKKAYSFNFEVFSSCCDHDQNSSSVFFCGRLAMPLKDDMKQIIDYEDEITSLISVLKNVRLGCHCLISSGPLLMRLRAAILCALYSCFEKVFVYMSGYSSILYLVGWNFRGCSTILENYLSEVLDLASTSLLNDFTLLELVPISILYNDDFYKFIVETNNNFIRMRFDHLLQNVNELYRTAANEPNASDNFS